MEGKQEELRNVYDALSEPFPNDALSTDDARGFDLTSIKAAHVIERLNVVFGLCGFGWRFAHSTPTLIIDPRPEYTCQVALQYRIAAEEDGSAPIDWTHVGWQYRADGVHCWSEPVFAEGGNGLRMERGGSVPTTDSRKGALTNGITKAASMIGVGVDVFKGERRLGGGSGGNGRDTGPVDAGEATITTVNFGKYKNSTLGEIMEADSGYIAWLAENWNWDKGRKLAQALIDAQDGRDGDNTGSDGLSRWIARWEELTAEAKAQDIEVLGIELTGDDEADKLEFARRGKMLKAEIAAAKAEAQGKETGSDEHTDR